MKLVFKKGLLLTGFVIIVVLVLWYIFPGRYYLQVNSRGMAYKIDRFTGETWVISPNGKTRLVESEAIEKPLNNESPETQAINMAKVNTLKIEEALEKKKGKLIAYGWEAKDVGNGIYLVGYMYDDGNGKEGVYFEAQPKTNILRLVSGDDELEQLYGINQEEE